MLPLSYWIIAGATIVSVELCVALHDERLRRISGKDDGR